RGRAGALQPHARVPRRRRCRSRGSRRAAVHALQGRRSVAGDNRAVQAPQSRGQQRAAARARSPVTRVSGPLVGATLSLACLAALSGADTTPPVTFVDVTAAAGIRFVHTNGAFGRKYLPETLGSGCAFVDVDGDGWQDIVLVNGTSWPG